MGTGAGIITVMLEEGRKGWHYQGIGRMVPGELTEGPENFLFGDLCHTLSQLFLFSPRVDGCYGNGSMQHALNALNGGLLGSFDSESETRLQLLPYCK